MGKAILLSAAVCFFISGVSFADVFAEGTANEFKIDFVPISGANNPASGIAAGDGFTFTGVTKDYRMGTYEITNAQFARFASNSDVHWTGADVPSNNVTWFEAAQFVNWLNTSTENTAAYKFNDGAFTVWEVTDTGYDASNPFRNSNAKYFLPTENEWVKAAYWNGSLQTYATKAGESLYKGNGENGGWNYESYPNFYMPWAVGSGSEELNGTFDMMGNVWEWMESPYNTGDCPPCSNCGMRGGSYEYYDGALASSFRYGELDPYNYGWYLGFRVASVPEPAVAVLLLAGAGFLRKRKG